MSRDLQVWSATEPALPASLPDAAKWRPAAGGWSRAHGESTIRLTLPDRVLPEDVPESVSAAVPGIAWLTGLSLSPVGAGVPSRTLHDRVALAIAKSAHGVVLDPQEDTVRTPRGVKRWANPGPSEAASLVNLSWWFGAGPFADGACFAELVDVLATELPEALPRRYGLYEPPQHVYATTGRAHLLDFLHHHARGIGTVWYPHPPVASLYLALPEEIGGSPKGFRSGRLEIEIDAEALRQPGWAAALLHAWRRIAGVVRPFYGDVRTFRGFRRSRSRFWVGLGTEQHPVCSLWWAGVPRGPAHAMVLGTPYLSLWPEFGRAAEHEGGLAFLSTGDWSSADDAFELCGPPPKSIAQVTPEVQGLGSARTYPPIWPFETPVRD